MPVLKHESAAQTINQQVRGKFLNSSKKLSLKKLLFIIAALLVFLTGIRVAWITGFDSPEYPEAVGGVLDLSEWDHLKNHSLSLNGEWEFLPQDSSAGPLFEEVPGIGSDRAGTYRLLIRTGGDEEMRYALRLPEIHSSADLYINGELMVQAGMIVSGEEAGEPAASQHLSFAAAKEPIELVIRVQSGADGLSGIVTPIRFGTPASLQGYTSTTSLVVLLACAVYLLHALYGFIIFTMSGRVRRDPRLLYFSLIILFIAFATLSTENLLYEWTPITYPWHVRITNLVMLLGGYLMMRMARQQRPDLNNRKWYRPYVFLLFALLALTAMLPLYKAVTYASIALTLFACVVLVKEVFQAMTKNVRQNIYLLLGLITALYSFFWLIFIEFTGIEMISYPFDLMTAIIFIAIHFFSQYFDSVLTNKRIMEDLKQADKTKDDFLLTAAYQMKHPVSGILWITKTLLHKENERLSDEGRESLKLLENVAHHMSFMLNDLRDLEKIQGNQLTLRMQPLSPHDVTEIVVDMLRFMVDEKNLKITNDIPVDFPEVDADMHRLSQILFNLLHNSIKFSDAGEVRITAETAGRMAEISVSDTGKGIDEQAIEQLFERYNKSPGHDQGIGLGLSLCKKLVELQGGEISFSSEAGKGSVFTFTVGLSDCTEAAAVDGIAAAVPLEKPVKVNREELSLHNYQISKLKHSVSSEVFRILVVDGDVVTLKMIETMFASAIFQVSTTTQAEEALELLDEKNWDLVIATVMMPRMSGYEFTRKVRERYSMAELPVLLLSTHNQEENIQFGFLAGANDYVTKPLKPAEFYSRVNALVNLKRSLNEQLQTEAAWLQAQIRPHFIINSFLSIAALSRVDLERMDDLTEQLTNYVRLSIDFRNSDELTPLSRELELIKSYLAIQKERFGERIRVSWNIEKNLQVKIPPLSIQCLVENAVIHGLMKKEGGGELRIDIRHVDEEMEIRISDTGIGMSAEEVQNVLNREKRKGRGIGLINTDKRLRRLYGKGLRIESRQGEGTTVSMILPAPVKSGEALSV